MAGPGGVQPFVVPLATSQGLPSGLRVGQTFQSVIQGQPGTLSVVIGGTRVPIGDLPQLIPGQVVRGEVLRVDSGLQIRITPQSASPAGPAGTPAPLSQVVATVLESLSALGAAGDAAHVLHQSMPANEAAVRNVLNLFLSDAQTGSDLNALLGTVNAAAQAGALSQRLADSFGLLVSTLVFAGDRDLRALLQHWRHGGRTVEGRLAMAMQSGRLNELLAELDGDLRGLLLRIRHDETFVRFLRGEGRFRGFQDATDRVLERLTGAALQNLKSLEQPYLFLDIPAHENTDLERLQLHFMSERKDGGKRVDPRNCTVAIDISLSRLGALWIVLRVVQSRCSCLIRAMSVHIVDTLRSEQAGFVESLASAGFDAAQVRFGLWQGNRLREVGQFLRQYARMDVKA